MSISPRHRAISPPTPAPSPQPDLHTSIRLANNAAAVAAAAAAAAAAASSSSGAGAAHGLVVDPHDPSQLLKHLSLVVPQYTQSARFKLVSELANLFSLRELAHLSSVITPRLKVDFLSALPIEVSLNILSFIDDPKTLARASCVSRFWRSLVNDEHTWKVMCLKHKYRRRGSSNAAIHSLDDRLMRSITSPLLAHTLSTPRITAASLAGPSSSAVASQHNSRSNVSGSLGVLLEQPLRAAPSSSDYGDDGDEFNDEDDAAVLASLYQRYRDRGLDPSNALHELRTLHDLFLSKQEGVHDSLNRPMSEADLAFYAQLEEIVQEESHARYGDESASLDDAVALPSSPAALAPASSRLLLTPNADVSAPSASSHLGWLSAGPASSVAAASQQARAVAASPPPASSPSNHAISAAYRTGAGRLDRLHGWQQPSTPAAALVTPRRPNDTDAEADSSSHIANDSDEAMDMDEQDDVASAVATTSSSNDAPNLRPIGQPPNALLLASLPHHDSPTGRFSASVASPSAATQAAAAAAAAAASRGSANSSSLVPGPREPRRNPVHRSAAAQGRRRSESAADKDDPEALAGLNLLGSAAFRSAVQERQSNAGPSRHSVTPPTAAHVHRHRSAKLPFSYRTHFKMAYLTESNWRKGGRLQTQHVSADAGHVVTSLAIDSEWIVVGMANSKIHVFSAETGLYAHTLLGHDAGVWCLTLISRTGKSRKHADAVAASERGKGKMVITDPEDGSGGKPYQAAADGDLRLIHHDPRPDAADVLLSPASSSAELTEEDVFGARRLPSSTSSTPASGKARQTYGHGETLQWFHKARRALRRQQGARRAAAAASTSASGDVLVDEQDYSLGAGDSDADLSNRSEGPSLVHSELRSSSRARTERENAQAIAEAEAGAIRDAVMADGTGQVPPELAEKIRRDGEMASAGRSGGKERARTASASGSGGAAAAAQLTGNALGMGNPCGSVMGYGNADAIVVSGGCDRDVRVWDLRTGECKHVLRGHTSTVRCLKVLDGKPIAVSGSRDSTLRVWNVETGEHVHLLAGHQHSVRCIEVAGNKVASGSYDGTCRVWDLDTGRCLHTLRGHIHYIYAVAFDGKRVATGSLDSTVRVWSAETGDCLALFQGHTSLVGQLQLLDNTLVTGGSDGRVIVFSLKTYECLHRLCAHDNSVTCLQFDERYIITGGNDGRVKLWDFGTGKFIREICEPCEQVWKVSYRDDKVVVLCKRGEKTCMDVITFRPAADEM
ncbi:related to F-box/WD40 repeat protein 7 [Sporisorium reilianum f. sp. reilianum]|uniref:Related to F-box/WD40 repeat protein 7 n=1 Tax=Sporisorium reilianum f. sp. reilianum TaxID=72559 RepID=A0A2N8ULR3_9BASI|nr:related to F-box/WD40 repeat protein 7 [Sporisorium reilianum f. sp. reilianum]